jgi:Flp pilus assembly protein TadG
VSGPRTPSSARRTRPSGQALVELALVLPVFLMMLFGIIDGARLVVGYNTVSQAAREGARRAVVQAPFIGKMGAQCTAPVCPSVTAFRTNVVAAASSQAIIVGPILTENTFIACTSVASAPTGNWVTPNNNCSTANAAGNVVSVRIVAGLTPITPIISSLIPSVTLASSATMALP